MSTTQANSDFGTRKRPIPPGLTAVAEDTLLCRVCGEATRTHHRGLHDDRYGFPGRFEVRACRSCGHRQLVARFKPEQLERLYSWYYPRRSLRVEDWRPYAEASGWRAWFNGERASAFLWVPKGVRVLDIGCGFGQTLGYHRARGCEAEGVEADANARRVADAFALKIKIGLFDPHDYAEASFDVVTLDQVIEHMVDPVATLRGIGRVLKPAGVVILSTPNPQGWGAKVFGRRWINWHVPYHLHQFSRRSMATAAERAGLRVTTTRTITSSEWLLYQWLHLFAFQYNGYASHFWSEHPLKARFLERKVVRLVRLLHRAGINHCLTRLFDALGLGDNRLYFLEKV